MSKHEPTVFVVQASAKVNLTPALEFGKIQVILPEGDLMFSPDAAVAKLRAALCDFTPEDHLLALGDPTAIGLACALVSGYTDGFFRMLKWDRQTKRYISLAMDVWGEARRRIIRQEFIQNTPCL